MSLGFPGSSAGKEFVCNVGDLSSIPGSGRSAGEGVGHPFHYSWASQVALLVKNPPAIWENSPGFDTWVGKIPWRRDRLTTPVFWPGEFHGLCSPWGHKESDTTERVSVKLMSRELNQGEDEICTRLKQGTGGHHRLKRG